MTDTFRSSAEPERGEPATDGRVASRVGNATSPVAATAGASAKPHSEQNFCSGATV
ncbi:MAG TPA: hypothetical protein VGF91_01320 [Solirubrobacteraceae bacterium]|jgi:hypothetical protein